MVSVMDEADLLFDRYIFALRQRSVENASGKNEREIYRINFV